MVKSARERLSLVLVVLPFVLIVLLFELAPLFSILGQSLFTKEAVGPSLQNYLDIFSKKLYRDAVLNSVQIALISSVIGIGIAFFAARAAQRTGGRGKSLFMSVLNMTSNFAGVPLAFSFIILMGNVGVLVMLGKSLGIEWLAEFNLYSANGLLLCYIYFQVPLATLLLIPAFDGLRKEWPEAVSLLGGPGWYYWVRVGIPCLVPSLLGTLSMLFANAIAAYATAYALLAGNFSLLPIRISEQFTGDVVQNKGFGSAMSVVLMGLMVLATLLNNLALKTQRRKAA